MKKNIGKKLISMVAAVCLTLTLLPSFALADVYDGDGGATGEVKRSVKVTLRYQYSLTGGMAGINAHSPETVEFFLNEDGTTTPASWPIPYYDPAGDNVYHDHDHNNLQGFRVVLNAAPLDELLKVKLTGEETPEELEAMLNRGDFNVRDDVTQEALTQAWIDGRTFSDPETGLVFQVVDENDHEGHGSDALVGPKLVLQNPQALTENKEVTVTVTYRRDNGEYTVRHLKPKSDLSQNVSDPNDWEEFPDSREEHKQGRIGAMTNAEAKFMYGFTHLAIAQQPIEVDGKTVIDIYYVKDDTFRVVFDTSGCNGEIDRQMPRLGETVDFSPAAVPPPTKDGYIFAGWSYRGKDADGNRGELIPVTEAAQYDSAQQKLELNEDFLKHAYFQPSQETAGVNVLRLYPIWEPGATQVRVVFWTEDLTGEDDVDSRVKGEAGDLAVVTHHYGEEDVEYSNAGSVTLTDVRTDCGLNVDKDTGTLTYTDFEGNPISLELRGELAKLPTMEVTTSFQTDKGFPEPGNTWDAEDETKCALNESSKFYTLDAANIHQREKDGKETQEESRAAAEGTTVVNVYYIRNVYQLEFHYVNTETGNTEVATHTRGYANRKIGHAGAANSFRTVNDEDVSLIPETVVLTAKYGADLRDAWPYRGDLTVRLVETPLTNKKGEAQFVSWTTTKGPYNAEARRRGLESSNSEPTIMGTYGAMSADIIADPERYVGMEGYGEADAHHLYAYWSDWQQNSYYRYNHCYEVPGVTQEMLESVGEQVILDGESADDARNIGYLIPARGENGGEVMELLERYNFDDLHKVRFDEDKGAGGVVTDNDGDYYAFRVYGDKCYALSRQVGVTSSNDIKAQNPSARSHMTRVNDVGDHSTKYSDSAGGYSGSAIGTEEEPYQLFFYYDRIPYTIHYSVGAYDLGQKIIYCGADLSRDYNIQLESGVSADGVTEDVRLNGAYALSAENPNGWELPTDDAGEVLDEVNVCPDRNAVGTKAWMFKGWALDQAGTVLLEDEDWDGVVSGNLRLYAQWETPRYTVEFDWNGGELAFGTNAEYKVQRIAANSSVRRGGLVPTPVCSGYAQESWQITAYEIDGEWHVLKPEEYQPFLIDAPIICDLRVQANWKAIEGANLYTYTVRHVLDSDRTVEIAQAQKVTGSFVPGSKVWGNPIKLKGEYAGYVPISQNACSEVPLEGRDIAPIEITYQPPTADDAYTYRVEFADWSTQTLIFSQTIPAAERRKTVYAGAYLDALDEMGYWLADEQGERMDGLSDALLVTLPKDGNNAARFAVGKQVYEIEYDIPQGMTAENWAEMEETLPKRYIPAEGAVELPVPGTNGIYEQDGKTYGFAGWKLTRGNLRGEPDSAGTVFETVTIDPESRGGLTFQARWEENYRAIDFLPGDHGTFADGKTVVSFSGLEETPLGEQEGFAVPPVTAAQGYALKGWRLTGDDAGKVYTAAEIGTLTPAVGRMVFTAQYEKKKSSGNTQPDVGGQKDPDDASTWLEREKHTAYIVGRDGGLVAPEAKITRAEVVTIFYRLLTEESRRMFRTQEDPFADVDEGDWFFEAAAAMAKAGIVEGRPGGFFAPRENITRGEFAAIAARFLSETSAPPANFSDIAGHWAEKYIDRAAQAGWIKGYPDGRFRPDADITRAEAITLVNAVLGRAPHKDGLHQDMAVWPDNADTQAWYYLAVQEATSSHEYTWQRVNGQQVEGWTRVTH